jgi:hypothetical protein
MRSCMRDVFHFTFLRFQNHAVYKVADTINYFGFMFCLLVISSLRCDMSPTLSTCALSGVICSVNCPSFPCDT